MRYPFSAAIVPLLSLASWACEPSDHPRTGDAGPEAGALEAAPPDAGCVEAGAESWDTQAARLDGTSTDANRLARIGIDGAGNAVVVWEQQSLAASTWTVWASQYATNGAWTAPRQIDGTGSTGIPIEPGPALAVSANGTAVVVYQTGSPGGPMPTNVTYAVYSPASGWGAATAFFPPTAPAQVGGNARPKVAIDSKGNAVAVWAQDMGDQTLNADFGLEIYAARAAAGQPFGPAVLLSSYAVSGFSWRPHVAIDEQGDAVAAWEADPSNSPIRVMAARFDGASWGAATFIDSPISTSNLGIEPRVVMDANRSALVVWAEGQSGGTVAAYSARYAAGSWSSAVQLDANLNTSLNASGARVVLDAAGNATAVWQNITNDSSHPNSILAARNVGGTWTPAAPLDTAKPGGNYRPELAVDDAGDVMVVWDDQGNVWAAQYDAARGSFSPEVNIDVQDNAAYNPDIAFAHGCPQAVVVYQNSAPGSGGNGSGIFSQRFH